MAKMNLMCWRLLEKHKQINGAPLYSLAIAWISVLTDATVCVGPMVGPETRAVTQTHVAYGIFFYHREVNTVGRPAE